MGGGTFIYPDAGMEVDLMGLTSDVFGGMTWHITGLVKKYAGFGLYLTCEDGHVRCYAGLAFDIQGTFTATASATAACPPRL